MIRRKIGILAKDNSSTGFSTLFGRVADFVGSMSGFFEKNPESLDESLDVAGEAIFP
jgi:hypothetical protein